MYYIYTIIYRYVVNIYICIRLYVFLAIYLDVYMSMYIYIALSLYIYIDLFSISPHVYDVYMYNTHHHPGLIFFEGSSPADRFS